MHDILLPGFKQRQRHGKKLVHILMSLWLPSHKDRLAPAWVDNVLLAQKGQKLHIVKHNFPKQEQGPISSAHG